MWHLLENTLEDSWLEIRLVVSRRGHLSRELGSLVGECLAGRTAPKLPIWCLPGERYVVVTGCGHASRGSCVVLEKAIVLVLWDRVVWHLIRKSNLRHIVSWHSHSFHTRRLLDTIGMRPVSLAHRGARSHLHRRLRSSSATGAHHYRRLLNGPARDTILSCHHLSKDLR